MLIGKNVRRVSHNLIISKYFEEENNEIQNQYFIRNVADELSVISLGFGGFFVAVNPCDFAIEYSTETFKDMNDINLKEVVAFEAKAATVFRIEGQSEMPEFDFEYIKSQLETEEERQALDEAIEAISGINAQYSIEQGSLGTSFDSIELNVEALNAANYKHLESDEYKIIAIEEEADELELEIARRKQELEQLNQELAAREEILLETEEILLETEESLIGEKMVHEETEVEETIVEPVENKEIEELSNELDDAMNDLLNPDDLFALFDEMASDEDNQSINNLDEEKDV